MTESPRVDIIHRLKNDIAIIVGFCDLMLSEGPKDDPRRADLIEVQKAAHDAMALMPEVARRLQEGDSR
jgi:hypothetical protein